MVNNLTVACLQTQSLPSAQAALEHALVLAKQAVANGAQFLLLPEYCGGLKTHGKAFTPPTYSEKEHPALLGLKQFAKDNQVWLLVGSVAIKGDNGKFLNRSFLLNSEGAICARYDKLHLFDIHLSETQSYKESEKVQHGRQAVVADTPIGRIGLSICYDLRFPNLYRDLCQAGAQIIVVPAAFTKRTGEAHWHVLNQSRAIENGAYVIAPCAVGKIEGGGESYGHSLVIDPWGGIVADGGEQAGVVMANIDLTMVAQTRQKIPSLEHDKPYELEQFETEPLAAKAMP